MESDFGLPAGESFDSFGGFGGGGLLNNDHSFGGGLKSNIESANTSCGICFATCSTLNQFLQEYNRDQGSAYAQRGYANRNLDQIHLVGFPRKVQVQDDRSLKFTLSDGTANFACHYVPAMTGLLDVSSAQSTLTTCG